MQFAQLISRSDAEAIQCDACQWRCVLQPGERGQCLVRSGHAEGIVVENHAIVSGAMVSPIEDHLLWHFFPDSRVLAVGGWGYAFPTDQKLRPQALIPDDEERRRTLEPERIASVALKQLCRGVVWAYGEPAVSHEYVLDVLRTCRAASRYTALVTTGYFTLEALDTFGHYLDGISLDLRGFGDVAYSRLAGVPHWRGILDVIARAARQWGCHVEITMRLHHRVNDDADELRALVEWICTTLGEQTPWHVLPGDAGAATAASVVHARRIGHEGGLKFIYGPESNQMTICPGCQAQLMLRQDNVVRLVGIEDGRCASCGYKLNLRLSIFKQ
jgi:pyruvate formate lyase activating enzyme